MRSRPAATRLRKPSGIEPFARIFWRGGVAARTRPRPRLRGVRSGLANDPGERRVTPRDRGGQADPPRRHRTRPSRRGRRGETDTEGMAARQADEWRSGDGAVALASVNPQLTSRTNPEGFVCPRCEAKAGEHCKGAPAKKREACHRERHEKAIRLFELWADPGRSRERWSNNRSGARCTDAECVLSCRRSTTTTGQGVWDGRRRSRTVPNLMVGWRCADVVPGPMLEA